MADLNPWSFAGWSITGQSAYVKQFGLSRAEARARDAGTILGGPKPMPPAGDRRYAEVGILRPGQRPVYRFLVPAKLDNENDNTRITDVGDDRVIPEGDTRGWEN